MSSIGPTATSPNGGATSPTSAAKEDARATLGKDDFLKLLVTQLQHQDPLNPMDDMQFMSQMAQFSTLEQITNLGTQLEQLSYSGQVSQGVGLIGRTVTYETKDGSLVTGTAESVELNDGEMTVLVDGVKVKNDSIRSVA
jgi:flagellar basal-body rod modification protein FlgD